MEGSAIAGQERRGDSPGAGLQRLLAVFRRRLRLFSGVVLSVLAVGLVLILTRTPDYTATATVALNTKKKVTLNSGRVAPSLKITSLPVQMLDAIAMKWHLLPFRTF